MKNVMSEQSNYDRLRADVLALRDELMADGKMWDTVRLSQLLEKHPARTEPPGARAMTEPVKRFDFYYDELVSDPENGEWCRYEPRFDEAQLSREEVELIEWAFNSARRAQLEALSPLREGPSWVSARLEKQRQQIEQLIARLRKSPSPWVPCSERTPDLAGAWSYTVWATDGKRVEKACRCRDGGWAYDGDRVRLPFTPTHWAPIVRPEPPRVE